ncbi:MAG: rRNA maturation RNase YbeY [Elusimicrobia bacterium GWC2_51_8]|nr:MAG: rRNA maturation RNase YbeY [Elusimicrobia bacterium GWA2_51_34]OGR64808.1 MAG: rRNA maturation RNase YbeY [Elusimicrobia bacterium GWC2_51_8]OGR86116.1 MAG: rRNA maturation RNase YbeY [Elusimicrobia bacterium GWF2_52_66]HAF96089.1 rRNA maturation RNase YbeY [Elusimicrobiota bacterium]HCE98697.1 rRNA maturation RNase YbeY [Elusimicrobiota bacterium]
MSIEIFFETPAPAAVKRARPLFKRAVRSALGNRLSKHTVCLIFTDDSGIKKLNKKFLGRNRVTDVISFNYPAPPGFKAPAVFGDIYVCLSRAGKQAKAMGHSVLTELLILSTHGALHLAGMNDYTPALRRRMNLKTAAILKELA